MLRWVLLVSTLVLVGLGSLNVFKAPSLTTWKLAILASEYGHWLALLALTLAAWTAARGQPFAPNSLAGWIETTALAVAVLAFGLLAKPTWQAWRLARTLPHTLTAAFGSSAETQPPFSWTALFRVGLVRAAGEAKVFAHAGMPDALTLDFFPAIGDGAAAPCVIVIHGGGWDNGDRDQLPELNAHLVLKGYAVASIDYRLAPQHTWPAQAEDITAAIGYVREHARALRVDPERLVLLGRSAGGQLATAVAYGAPERLRLRGVIALYAPHDLIFAWKYSDVRDVLNSPRLMRQFLGGTPDSAAAAFASASGFLIAQKDAPPTLLLHGALDALVWHRQSERMHAQLDELGVRNTFVSLPWATHAFDFNFRGPGGQLSTYAIDRFLAAVMR